MSDPLGNILSRTDPVSEAETAGLGAAVLWQALEEKLAERLGPDTAEMLARPVSEGDQVAWIGPQGRTAPLSNLPARQRVALREQVTEMLADIQSFGLRLQNAESDDLRSQARTLRCVAAELPDESVFVVEGRPVIVDWIRRETATHRARPTLKPATPVLPPGDPLDGGIDLSKTPHDAVRGAAGGGNILVPVTKARDTRFSASPVSPTLAGLAILLFLLAFLFVVHLLLGACGLAWPARLSQSGANHFWESCTAEAASEAALEAEVRDLEAQLQKRQAQCVQPNPAPPLEPVLEPVLEPEPETPLAPDPVDASLNLRDMTAGIGLYCSYALCNPTVLTDSKVAECPRHPQWIVDQRADVPSGQCRFVVELRDAQVPHGTPFGGTAELLIDGVVMQSWPFEAESVGKPVLEALDRNGRPHFYWVGTFPWPYPVD